MTPDQRQHTLNVLKEVEAERMAQHIKWGEQNHADFSAPELSDGAKELAAMSAATARELCEQAFASGNGNYADILEEEFYEAVAERDSKSRLRAELIQLAAVAVAWAEKIDRDFVKEKASE